MTSQQEVLMTSPHRGMTSPQHSDRTAFVAADDAVSALISGYDDEETISSSDCAMSSSESILLLIAGDNSAAAAATNGASSTDSCGTGTGTADPCGSFDNTDDPKSATDTSFSRCGRSLRRCRQDSETVYCPVCKLPLRSTDLKNHVQIELDRLAKINSSRLRKSVGHEEASPRKKAFLRIQKNRQARLRARMRRDDAIVDYTSCPICSELINGTPEELNEHVELCLNKIQRTDEEQDVDVDNSDDELEEYEWAGQTRVRASSALLRDRSGASGSAVTADDVTDLDIEDDDSATYAEADLLLLGSDEPGDNKNQHILRNAVLGCESSSARCSTSTAAGKWSQGTSDMDSQSNSSQASPTSSHGSSDVCTMTGPEPTRPTTVICLNTGCSSRSPAAVVQSLRSKVAELERQLQSADIPRCLICMETYTKPLTSIQCWHVHCEECWLRTLGAKKLCPQCNMITSPAQLRRIYL